MSSSLKQLMTAAGYATLASLAREVVDRWEELSPSRHKGSRKPRNVEVKLGLLRRGDPTWWRNHPAASRALMDLLGASEVQLGFEEAPALGPRWEFGEFAELKALDLTQEKPADVWGILAPGKFFPSDPFRALPQAMRAWLHIPVGGGRHLLARVWEENGMAEVVHGLTVADCRDSARNALGPVALVVESPAPTDGEVLDTFSPDVQVVVLAPFRLPPRARRADLGAVWDEYAWRTTQKWRRHFARWVAERLPGDSQLKPRRFAAWLDELDPTGSWFATPGSLLPLCAYVHRRGLADGMSPRQLVVRFLSHVIRRAKVTDKGIHAWLKARGPEVLYRLTAAHWEATEFSYVRGLTRSEWAALLPQDALGGLRLDDWGPGSLPDLTPDEATSLSVPESVVPSRVQPADALAGLEAAGLLRVNALGLARVWPYWLAEGWIRERVRRAFDHRPPRTWGRWGLDSERRRLIDDELSRLPDWDFAQLVERVTTTSPETLGDVAAIETVYFAVAQRMQAGWRGDAATISDLFERQRACMVQRHEDGGPVPMTRPAAGDWSETSEAWLAACWTWSFLTRPPAGVETLEPWLFPGWRSPSLADTRALHRALGSPGTDTPATGLDHRGLPSADERRPFVVLKHFARDVVAGLPDARLPDELPPILLPAIVLAASARGWVLRGVHLDVIGTRWAREHLMGELRSLTTREQQSIAATLLQTLSSEGFARFCERLRNLKDVGDFVIEQVSDEELAAAVGKLGGGETEREPAALVDAHLPRRLRLAMTRWMLRDRSTQVTQLCEDRAFLASENDAELVAMLAEGCDDRREPIRAMWRLASERAFRQALDAWEKRQQGEIWFDEAPIRQIARLLEHLEADQAASWPSWIERWLARVLHAQTTSDPERVFALLQRARASASTSRARRDSEDEHTAVTGRPDTFSQ